MGDGLESLPDDIETLKAALIVARAEAAAARARQSDDQALIAHLKLQIEKLNRDRYGPRSERTARLLDQLELTLEELESSATEDELAAEMAAAKTTKVSSFTRKRPSRQPFPEHLASRAGDRAGTCGVCLLWRRAAVQTRRGHHRDAGGGPEVLEGDPARPREVYLSRLREDQPGPSAFPRHRSRLGGSQPFGDGAVREVRPAPAPEPAS